MKLSVLILILFPLITFAQTFKLVEPNVHQLEAQIKKSDYRDEVIYLYLIHHYDSLEIKQNVKHYKSPDFSTCSFNQKFKNNIEYKIEQSRETGETSISLTLPKMERQNLMKWIEKIYESISIDKIEHGWNEDKTKFRPVDKGVGCYYTISETEASTIVHNYCGG